MNWKTCEVGLWQGGNNGVARIFLWGGSTGRCHPVDFPSSPETDQIQWGGGVEIFRHLHQRTRFAGGGVVAAEISVGPYFPVANPIQWGGRGGGVVGEFFPVAAGKDQSNSLNSGTFFDISGTPADHPPFMETHGNSGRLGRPAYTFKERNNINSMEKKNI